jgi:glycosyltransferase involved in cell wall biosynthesis
MIDPAKPDFTYTPVSPQRPNFNYTATGHTEEPFVTIITPFHNTGGIFHETARSVFQQSFQQWEWVIVNDASTDLEALSILEEYRDRDSRIRVIDHTTNQGPSAARNTAFRAAQTQYVVQLDSDNLLELTAIEKWLWYLVSHPEYSFVKGFTVGFGAEEYLWQQGFHNREAFLDDNQLDTTSLVRKSTHQSVGGFDESNRDGLEDWDFWLRCASNGYWGSTIPEYLDWYRRRPNHTDRWRIWDRGKEQRGFRKQLRQRHSNLWNNGFPQIELRPHLANDDVPDVSPCKNRLGKDKPRLLMIVPWLTMGGADKFNLDLLAQLTQRGWEVTITTTLESEDNWFPLFAQYTPDIFILHHFLRLVDYPRFLRYLIHSRQVDVVYISHSELGYQLLPYLRAHCPEVTFVDYDHIEQEDWKNGGYPRLAVEYQELLDLNIVSSEHLKRWMIERGAEPDRIEVCYTNICSEKWQPDPQHGAAVRTELGLDNTIPMILYAGRICPQKQPRVLAQTLLQLVQRKLDFTALVAGDGEDMNWLRGFIEQHKLADQVHLMGAISNQRIKELMTAADILFLPSQWEGIALSIYEAMALGLAVVGADVGGQQELVTLECGELITRSDEKSESERYATILAKLLADPQRCHKMGQAGRKRISTYFRLEQMGENMAALLEQAKNLRAEQSRPIPSVGLGQACAAQAVEYVRIYQLADQLWNKYENKNLENEHQENTSQVNETRILELEEAKEWLEEQRDRWQRTVEERERVIQEQQAWINELEEAKTWLEEQRDNWQQLAKANPLARVQHAWQVYLAPRLRLSGIKENRG